MCRDFLRGNCRFGSRCKFLHEFPQQQRQQPAFGVKNQGQHQPLTVGKGGNYYSPLTSQKKEKTRTPLKEHRCTELKECKLQIKEDLENEQPVFWSLTCYAHGKYLPNDVDGDVSFEELRAHAYAAGKQGVPFDGVVQNERSMFAGKKKEFDYILENPYTGPASSGRGFHGNNVPQQEALKMSFGTATPGFSSSANGPSFGPTGPLQNSAHSRELFGSGGGKNVGGFSFGLSAPSGPAASAPGAVSTLFQSLPAPSFSFGTRLSEPKPFVQGSSSSNPFGSSPLPLSSFGQGSPTLGPSIRQPRDASQGLFGSSYPTQNILEAETSSSLLNRQAFGMPNVQDTSMNQSMTEVMGQNVPAGLLLPKPTDPSSDVADIWLKETWTLGEIPEEEPPLYAR